MVEMLLNPLVHVALIAIAVYGSWLYPLQTGYSAVALAITLLMMFVTPGCNERTSGSFTKVGGRYFPTGIYSPTSARLFLTVAILGLLPLWLVLTNVVPWHIGAYLALCVLVIAFYVRRSPAGIAAERVTSNIPTGPSRITLAWFDLLVAVCFYLLLIAWPYVAARGLSFPQSIGSLIAWFETLSSRGNSYSVPTRSGMTLMVGSSGHSATLLICSENSHLLLWIMLLAGSFLRTGLIGDAPKYRSAACDLLAVLFAAVLYVSATWRDVLVGDLDAAPWPHRGTALLVCAALWLAIRLTLVRAFDWSATRPSNSSPLRIVAIPSFFSSTSVVCGLIVVSGVLRCWHDPGHIKPGRIIIDEHHSDWEKSTLPMETEFYGVKTLYNYAFFREILEKHFSSVTTNHQPIDSALLQDCDVLILKTPTQPYLPSEVAAIAQWVENGGGLWLVGDHTNIFGMNTYLNQIAASWGIRFNADAVSPLPHFYQQNVHVAGLSPYHKCGNRSHENLYSRTYLNHPIIGHHIPYLAVLTSCSVSGPLDCEYVSIARGVYADHAKFGGNTFFGNLTYDTDERYGHVLQNIAVKSGKGRVALWSDSTLFSNFSMCMSGVPQLALGYASWLNRSNLIESAAYRTMQFTTYALLVLTVFWSRNASNLILGGLAGVLLVGCLVPLIDFINTRAYAPQDFRKGFQTVGFEEEYSNIELPNKDHVHTDDPTVFETFYVMMQRLHLMPTSADKLADVLPCDALVLINPTKAFAGDDIARLNRHLKAGGALILMVGIESAAGNVTAHVDRLNDLLERLGAADRFEKLAQPIVTDLFGSLFAPTVYVNARVGVIAKEGAKGSVLLRRAEGDALVVSRTFNGGKLILCSHADMYSNIGLGQPTDIPSGKRALLVSSCFRFVNSAIEQTNDQRLLREPWERLLHSAGTADEFLGNPDDEMLQPVELAPESEP